jgi:hypothetical protein
MPGSFTSGNPNPARRKVLGCSAKPVFKFPFSNWDFSSSRYLCVLRIDRFSQACSGGLNRGARENILLAKNYEKTCQSGGGICKQG